MGSDNGEDHQLLWLEGDEWGEESPIEQVAEGESQVSQPDASEDKVRSLEDELQRTRKELADVRKELAAKTVQLSRKEAAAVQEKVQERVAEATASVSAELQRALQQATAQVQQLEVALTQKEEELDEARRLYTAQKRALKEAVAQASELEAASRNNEEAQRVVVAQAVEDELDRLQHELVLVQTRSELELRARDTELSSLRQQLKEATAKRKEAVQAAEAALTEAWQAEVDKVQAEASARVAELEEEVVRLRGAAEEARRGGDMQVLTAELAALNNQKVQIQREFEAFKEMATQAARNNREEVAKLLDQNAALHHRLAQRAVEAAAAVGGADLSRMHKVFAVVNAGAPPPSGVVTAKENDIVASISAVLARWERQRKGLVPVVIIGSLLLLILTIAVIRAAAATRHEHRGGLCFLAHLGIWVGKGCEPDKPPPLLAGVGAKAVVDLNLKPLIELETTQRVHDVAIGAEEDKGVASVHAGHVPAGTDRHRHRHRHRRRQALQHHDSGGTAGAQAAADTGPLRDSGKGLYSSTQRSRLARRFGRALRQTWGTGVQRH